MAYAHRPEYPLDAFRQQNKQQEQHQSSRLSPTGNPSGHPAASWGDHRTIPVPVTSNREISYQTHGNDGTVQENPSSRANYGPGESGFGTYATPTPSTKPYYENSSHPVKPFQIDGHQAMLHNMQRPSRGHVTRQGHLQQQQPYHAPYQDQHHSRNHDQYVRHPQNESQTGNQYIQSGFNHFSQPRDAAFQQQSQGFVQGQSDGAWHHSSGMKSGNPVLDGAHTQQTKGGSIPGPSNSDNMPMKKSISPNKDRIIQEPLSPDTISWDNPFPTFPTNRAKNEIPTQHDLNAPVSNMSIDPSLSKKRSPDPQYQVALSQQRYGSSPERDSLKGNVSEMSNKGIRPPDSAFANNFLRGKHGERNIPNHGEHAQFRSRNEAAANTFSQGGYLRRPHDAGYGMQGYAQRPLEDTTQRSKTMPSTISETIMDFNPNRDYADQTSGRSPNQFIASGHSKGNNSGERYVIQQQRPPMPMRSHSTETSSNHYGSAQQRQERGPQKVHAQHNSLGEVLDSYYAPPQQSYSRFGGNAVRHQQPTEERMPDFDVLPELESNHKRGTSIDQHLKSQQETPKTSSRHYNDFNARKARSPVSRALPEIPRSKSSPNLNFQHGPVAELDSDFKFELPGSVPAMPQQHSPHNGRTYNDGQAANRPNLLVQSQNLQRDTRLQDQNYIQSQGIKSTGTSPVTYQDPSQYEKIALGSSRQNNVFENRLPQSPSSVPSPPLANGAPFNPDALPQHPAPVRAGLLQNAPPTQPPKPPPMRRYDNGSSPLQEISPTQSPQTSRSSRQGENSPPVTYAELERLKQDARAHPSDHKIQMVLAKRLAEAALVLADEGGRADQKTSVKNRERYMADAQRVLKKLIQNGYPEAMFFYGDCHSRGALGLNADAREAFGLYQSAAKAGHAQAAYRVAVCCEMGLDEGGGTKRDPLKAMQWYQRASTLGDTPAMYKMGIIQLKGLLGQPKNPAEALTWLKQAAERADKENPHALHELALLHESPSSIQGVVRDEQYARRLFTQAANLGYKFSQFRLGCAYEYGLLSCPIDSRQSIAWYSKAAVQEEHQSELALSGWYLTGAEGVLQQSDTEAYLWARKAARAGLAKAEYAMGYFTEVGIGAPSNLEDAKRWYWRSAAQNFPKARDRLEDLRRGGARMEKTRVSRSKIDKHNEGECVVM